MEKTKEKECPFRKDLACDNCRFYEKAAQGMRCIFKSIQWAVEGIDMFEGKAK